MMSTYTTICHWSLEDNAMIANVPELPGCMAHGDSQAAALASVNEAIALWITTAEALGRAVPTPKGRRLAYA